MKRSINLWAMALTIATAVSAHALDHSTFDRILKKYVKSGVVNYKGLKADKDFPGYLQTISHTKVSGLSQSEQLSFWINAYNASCLNGVLRRYPIKSVMNDKQFFSKKEHKVAGQTLSLNDVEHGILRKQFKEPRIHFAVNCASKSCPPAGRHRVRGEQVELPARCRRPAIYQRPHPQQVRRGREKGHALRPFQVVWERLRLPKPDAEHDREIRLGFGSRDAPLRERRRQLSAVRLGIEWVMR